MKITEESLQEHISSNDPGLCPPAEPVLSEREKLKSMNQKDKLWYIWEYYKLHMLAVVIGLVLLWTVGSAMYRSSFDTVFYCMYLNSRSEEGLNMTPLEQGFGEFLGAGSKDVITGESSFISFGDGATEFSYATMAKISALVASKDLDVMIGDTESFGHYASLDAFADWEAQLSDGMLAALSDRFVYETGEDGIKKAYGISLAGTPFAENSHLSQEPPILSMLSNSTRRDNVLAFLSYVFGL